MSDRPWPYEPDPPRRDNNAGWKVVGRATVGRHRRVWQGKVDPERAARPARYPGLPPPGYRSHHTDPGVSGNPVSPEYGSPAPYGNPTPPSYDYPDSTHTSYDTQSYDTHTSYDAQYDPLSLDPADDDNEPEYPIGQFPSTAATSSYPGTNHYPGTDTNHYQPNGHNPPNGHYPGTDTNHYQPTGYYPPVAEPGHRYATPAEFTAPPRSYPRRAVGRSRVPRSFPREGLGRATPSRSHRGSASNRATGRARVRAYRPPPAGAALENGLEDRSAQWPSILGWTMGCFVVPLLLYLVWAMTRVGAPPGCVDATGAACVSPRGVALSTFLNALPGFAGAAALSVLAAVGLWRLNYTWRPPTIGIGGAVIGAGVATVIGSSL